MFRFSCFVHVAPKSSVLESGSSTTKMVEKLFGERKKNIYKQKTKKKKKEKTEEKSKERKMRKRRRVEFHICSMLSPRLFSPFSFSSSSSSSSKKKKNTIDLQRCSLARSSLSCIFSTILEYIIKTLSRIRCTHTTRIRQFGN